ncbi:phytoene/squalene synthase family protein [Candidatus Cyanaurora vandensis]|uniref:phytoene/squalene synthase family protein n=1 Tax=Candidatus Cyanaurora vandensis TaxID=2714958 RepID=UPI00257B977A|nr:phytoene/squalene synthase family protein [Candidatus Cyanaurora vandensis]
MALAVAATEREKQAVQVCREILPEVSRTFALSIRFLPGGLGQSVLCAYLLCRIADTIEDDPVAPPAQKIALLDDFMKCFTDPLLANDLPKIAQGVQGEAAHLRLISYGDLVFTLFRSLSPRTQATVRQWVGEMVSGMQHFVGLYPRGIRIQTISEYKKYCYYVAGTVGHLLTDLWYEYSGYIHPAKYNTLLTRCEAFGQALQTVNILKDIAWDAEHENSIYVPAQALQAVGSSHQHLLDPALLKQNRAALGSLMELAQQDLDDALAYLLSVPNFAISIRLFCILPLLFAYATLRELDRSVAMLQPGGSVKISRREVKSLILAGCVVVMSNHGVQWLVTQVRRGPFIWGLSKLS